MELVSARCTSCGGEIKLDVKKETGFCLHCGSSVIVKDAVLNIKIDQSHLVDNYMTIIKASLDGENFHEVEVYCNKIIEIDPTISKIWFLKGKVIIQQSSTSKFRFAELISCWINAINNHRETEEQNKEEFLNVIRGEIRKIVNSIVSDFIDRFSTKMNIELSKEIVDHLGVLEESLIRLNKQTSLEVINVHSLFSYYIREINESVRNIFDDIKRIERHGSHDTANSSDYSLNFRRITSCTILLEKLTQLGNVIDREKVAVYYNLINLYKFEIHLFSKKYPHIKNNKLTQRKLPTAKKVIASRRVLISESRISLNELRRKVY